MDVIRPAETTASDWRVMKAYEGPTARIESLLEATLAGAGPLAPVIRPLLMSPSAKRVRPRLIALVGEALFAPAEVVASAAVAVELIHTASLLHDDIVDGATERRGLPSANHVWGAPLAVLAGDLLLSRALVGLRPLGPVAVDRATDVVAEMTRGVADELAARRDFDLDAEAWRRIAVSKSGALFGLGPWLVARQLGSVARADGLDEAMRRLGVAFQIADDAADFLVPEVGLEPPWQDLRDGVPSLPVIFALFRDRSLRDTLRRHHNGAPRDLADLAAAICASGAIDDALAAMREELDAARDALVPEFACELREHEGGLARILAWADTLATSLDARYARLRRPERWV
jgi:geranylgeranyl pyrophosphate synthase